MHLRLPSPSSVKAQLVLAWSPGLRDTDILVSFSHDTLSRSGDSAPISLSRLPSLISWPYVLDVVGFLPPNSLSSYLG